MSRLWRWLRTLTSRPTSGAPTLRPVELASVDPYRAQAAARPIDRVVTPCTLAQLLASLTDAGLAIHPRRHGFDVLGPTPTRVLPVRVRDPARVTPQDLRCGTRAPELLLDLALALLPRFGPVLVELPFAGAMLVDGSRDRDALGEDAAQRIQRVGRRVATRAPVSSSILLDLARRMRQPR